MNWELLGHEWAVSLLREHIISGHLRHAYLITGPQGVGRRTLALHLAQALNCQQAHALGEFCGKCLSCQQTLRMQHPDLSVIESESPTRSIKVEQIRDLQHRLSLAPYSGRYRVALLLRMEEATISAQNALLKTLEEPASQVVLVLTAESAERLLPTVVSRCEVLRLRPLPIDSVREGLIQRQGASAEQANLLAHISGGRAGYAMRLYEDPAYLEQRQNALADLFRLFGCDRVDRFIYAYNLSRDKNPDAVRETLAAWISLWRDVLICSSGAAAPLANLDQAQEIQSLAHRHGLQGAHQVVTALERTLEMLAQNVNARLALEVLMLDLPQG